MCVCVDHVTVLFIAELPLQAPAEAKSEWAPPAVGSESEYRTC